MRSQSVPCRDQHEASQHEAQPPRIQHAPPIRRRRFVDVDPAPVVGVLRAELLALPFAIAGALIGARRGWLEGERELRAWAGRLRHAAKVHAQSVAHEVATP
jgi:hypothetical protein